MKVKLLFVLLLAAMFMGGGAARKTVFNVSGRVLDADGRGVPGVVVNNGERFVLTGADGRWSLMTDTLTCKYVSISTPADYRLPSADGIAAGFYVPVGEAIAAGGHDFRLEKRKERVDSFYYVAISDPQVAGRSDMGRWLGETMKDVRRTADSLGRLREVVGVALGDLVFDNMPLYGDYARSISNTGMTMFQCIGNHDFDARWQDLHNMRLGTPVYGEMTYGRWFGPTDYSFNIGKAHVVTMKNINYVGGGRYVESMTDAQIAWLEKDLSYVPKGSLVILNMHAPGWNEVGTVDNMKNADRLAETLKGYRTHVFCGHTHFFQNVEVSPELYQHNIGAACGAWWSGYANRCGAPNGYMIASVEGDSLTWRYKPTGQPADVQMRVYAPGEFATQRGYVVANVWDYDSRWKVEWYQDGRPMGAMEQFADVDQSYARRAAEEGDMCATPHLFRCRPGEGCGEVRVVASDRFGRVHSASVVMP